MLDLLLQAAHVVEKCMVGFDNPNPLPYEQVSYVLHHVARKILFKKLSVIK
jgi:hypothetical protein